MPVPLRVIRQALAGSETAMDFRARMRALAFPEPAPTPELPQLVFWIVDADGLPERPWRILASDLFRCRTLACFVEARVCVARQLASDLQRTRDTWRGEASDYPHCVTAQCAQGRGIREALDPAAAVQWRGVGPGRRFVHARRDAASVAKARARKRASGLLDDAPTIDTPAGPVEEEG